MSSFPYSRSVLVEDSLVRGKCVHSSWIGEDTVITLLKGSDGTYSVGGSRVLPSNLEDARQVVLAMLEAINHVSL